METDSPTVLNADELQFLTAIRQATPEQRRNLVRRMQADAETSATPFPTKVRRELKRLSMTQIEVVAALGVDTGKVFKKVFVTEDMVGHRLGEFSLTRTWRGHTPAKKKAAP